MKHCWSTKYFQKEKIHTKSKESASVLCNMYTHFSDSYEQLYSFANMLKGNIMIYESLFLFRLQLRKRKDSTHLFCFSDKCGLLSICPPQIKLCRTILVQEPRRSLCDHGLSVPISDRQLGFVQQSNPVMYILTQHKHLNYTGSIKLSCATKVSFTFKVIS